MTTLEQQCHKTQRRLNAGETIMKEAMADAADIAETMPGLDQADKDALASAAQTTKDAMKAYHDLAEQKCIKGGVTPQSSPGDKD